MNSLLTQFGIVLGFLLVLRIIIFYGKTKTANTLLLAIAIFFSWFSLLVGFLNHTRTILQFPYLIRTGLLAGYLDVALLFLYVRNSFYPGATWRKRDWLFLLPAVFYLIDMFPFFISSSENKIAVFKASLQNPPTFLKANEGWIAITDFHFAFQHLWDLTLNVLMIIMIIRNRNVSKEAGDVTNKTLFWFLVVITLGYLPLSIPGIIGVLMSSNWLTMEYINVTIAIVLITITLYLFFYPRILLGFKPRPTLTDIMAEAVVTNQPALPTIEPEDSTVNLSRGDMKRDDFLELVSKLDQFMLGKKPFLDDGYNIHSLSNDFGVPVYQLSPLINQHYGDNFSSWINRYRVDYFISLWEDGTNRELTLEALASKSGFANRRTFINAFKKAKNTTPSLYLKTEAKNDAK